MRGCVLAVPCLRELRKSIKINPHLMDRPLGESKVIYNEDDTSLTTEDMEHSLYFIENCQRCSSFFG